jgi:hypothetical protein
MSPPDNGRSVPSSISQAEALTNHLQLTSSPQQKVRPLPLATQRVRGHVPERTPSSPPEPKLIPRLLLKIRLPSLFTRLKTITRKHLPPSQILCKARSALLKEKDNLSENHPLRGRVEKNNGSLEPIPRQRAPTCERVFLPNPPEHSLKGLSRARQRDRVGSPRRKVMRSKAQDKLRETQINEVEYGRWTSREPRVLAGLGKTFMGPSANAPITTIVRWVMAKTELKQHNSFDKETFMFFEKQNLILLDPISGLPLHWDLRWCGNQWSYFFNTATKRKQWEFPKGTDVQRFMQWFGETFESNFPEDS